MIIDLFISQSSFGNVILSSRGTKAILLRIRVSRYQSEKIDKRSFQTDLLVVVYSASANVRDSRVRALSPSSSSTSSSFSPLLAAVHGFRKCRSSLPILSSWQSTFHVRRVRNHSSLRLSRKRLHRDFASRSSVIPF